MKSLLFSFMITGIWPKGKWSLNGKTEHHAVTATIVLYIDLESIVSLDPHTLNSLPALAPGSGI